MVGDRGVPSDSINTDPITVGRGWAPSFLIPTPAPQLLAPLGREGQKVKCSWVPGGQLCAHQPLHPLCSLHGL